MGRCLLQEKSLTQKGMTSLAEIRDGGRGRLSRFDIAFLAVQLYRQQNGNTVSLRDVRD